jgi:hypothetical protein
VCDHDDRHTAIPIETCHEIHDLAAGLGVQIPGGLISQQNAGIGHNSPGDRDALLLSTG